MVSAALVATFGDAEAEVVAEHVADPDLGHQLDAEAAVVARLGAAPPGIADVEEKIHREAVESDRRHHAVAIEVLQGHAPLERGQARAVP